MIKCDDCVTYPVCDFCGYYNFNGDENGAYIDKGWCNRFNRQEDPECGEDCDEFICVSTEQGKLLRQRLNV